MTETSSEVSVLRRNLLLAGVGVGAAAAGAGLAWWKFTPQGPDTTAPDGLWDLRFDTPVGTQLSLASFRGKPLLINFWATWCPPCIEELPLLDRFFRENKSKSWQVVGLAVDQMAPVQAFLSKAPLSFPVALAGLGGIALSKSMGNLAGGLPFTVVMNREGVVAHRKMGKVIEPDLQAWSNLS